MERMLSLCCTATSRGRAEAAGRRGVAGERAGQLVASGRAEVGAVVDRFAEAEEDGLVRQRPELVAGDDGDEEMD